MKRALAAIAVSAALAGCGERPQHVQYENGRYAGKPDTPVWQSEQFGNDREQWQRAIRDRNLKQSEYTRMRGSG